MHHFDYKNGTLCCEDVRLADIAREIGTPFYCYSHATLTGHLAAFQKAFAGVDHLVCYSVKVCSNISLLKALFERGAGADIVSGGELYRALKAGVDPKKVVYSGVGKKEEEIRYALKTGILMFNVESPLELLTIDRLAGEMGVVAQIAIRVNPDVDPRTHAYISTGLKKNKFGIAIERALVEYRAALKLANIKVVGVDCHIGSQITEISPFIDAIARIKELVLKLKEEGVDIKYFDVGGGLGIPYNAETPPHPDQYGEAVVKAMAGLDCKLIMEPGRAIAGNAGVLVGQVQYTKDGEDRRFLIGDTAMNDLIRPSLYGSYHAVRSLKESDATRPADLVGPICESGDFMAKDRDLPDLKAGDLYVVMSAGGYGFSMSSNYNSRPRAAEVLVKGDKYFVIRTRETYEDLVRGEDIPAGI